jgi:site-specific DNA-cytosine methylase
MKYYFDMFSGIGGFALGAKWAGADFDGSWEEGIPRVLKDIKNRASRLKCLGNAVVPQITAMLWNLVLRALWT